MSLIKRFDRVAFAVGDLETSRRFFEDVLGASFGEAQEVKDFSFRYQPFSLGGLSMALLCPDDPSSVIGRFLMKHRQGFHHISFEVESLDEATAALEAKGVAVVSRHDYQDAFEGYRWKEAFLHPRDAFGLLIHLVEKTAVPGS